MNDVYWNTYLSGLPNVLLALAVFVIGFLLAKMVERAIVKSLTKTKWDERMFVHVDTGKIKPRKVIGKIGFFLVILVVLLLVFNILGLNLLAGPFVSLVTMFALGIPSILKAALILLFAWIFASTLSFFVKKLWNMLKIDHFLYKWHVTDKTEEPARMLETVSKAVFYLVLLLFLPAVLNSLNLSGVSEPFSAMVNNMLAFIPKLFAALLILIIGWFVAKIIREIVKNVLQALGLEQVVARLGVGRLFEGTTLSNVISTVVFIFVMIPVVIAALDRLDLNGISEPAIAMLNHILVMLPNIAVAVLLVCIGILLAKWLNKQVASLLKRLGVDSIIQNSGIGRVSSAIPSISFAHMTGYVVQIIVVLLFVAQALNVLHLQFFVILATGIVAYLPHLLVAIMILGVGLYFATIVKEWLIHLINEPHNRLLANIAKYTIITVSIFMALDQLGVADSIVNAAFILLLGGLALAFGLAFGLGGKEFAAKYLQRLDRNIDQTKLKQHRMDPRQDDFPSQPFE